MCSCSQSEGGALSFLMHFARNKLTRVILRFKLPHYAADDNLLDQLRCITPLHFQPLSSGQSTLSSGPPGPVALEEKKDRPSATVSPSEKWAWDLACFTHLSVCAATYQKRPVDEDEDGEELAKLLDEIVAVREVRHYYLTFGCQIFGHT